MKRICAYCCVAVFVIVCQISVAVPIDASSGTTQTAVVDNTGAGDYLNLAAAATDFDNVAGGVNRPWIISVNTNTVEPVNVPFGNTFNNGSSLTIKPASGKTPTVTITATAGNTSINGNLLFGVNTTGTVAQANLFATANGFIIDGSNTVGGTTRDLTITNTSADTNGQLLRIAGACNGMVIKNTNLVQLRSGTTNNVIGFAGGVVGTFTMLSNNVVVNNCYLESLHTTSATNGIGINYSTQATGTALPSGTNFDGHVYSNNTFKVTHRALAGVFIAGMTVTGNTFSIRNAIVGGNSWAVGHVVLNGAPASPFTVTIANNMINDLQTSNTNAGALGIYGIDVGAGGTGTYNIYNNVVTGINLNGSAAAAEQHCLGISCDSPADTYVVEHNSVNVAPQTKVTGAVQGNAAGISVNATLAGTVVRNNIVSFSDAGTSTAAFFTQGTSVIATGNVVGNDLFAGPGVAALALFGSGTAFPDETSFAGAGYNGGGGQSVDPAGTTPPWNTSNLSFASAPSGLGTVASSTILTDINGQTRPATGAYPGAYRIVAPSRVTEWSLY